MLSKVGLAAMTIMALASTAWPAAANEGDGSEVRHRRGAFSALSPDPDGTADTVVPGERLSHGEVDARIGWLVQTYIMDTRAALRRDHIHVAVETLARARSALHSLEQRSDGHIHDLRASDLAASLAQAERALSAGDRTGADRALADGERGLHAALVALDDALLPQSGAPQ